MEPIQRGSTPRSLRLWRQRFGAKPRWGDSVHFRLSFVTETRNQLPIEGAVSVFFRFSYAPPRNSIEVGERMYAGETPLNVVQFRLLGYTSHTLQCLLRFYLSLPLALDQVGHRNPAAESLHSEPASHQLTATHSGLTKLASDPSYTRYVIFISQTIPASTASTICE